MTAGSAVGTIFNLGTSIVTIQLQMEAWVFGRSFQVVSRLYLLRLLLVRPIWFWNAQHLGNAAISAWTATATDNSDTNVDISKTLINTADQCGNSSIQLYRFCSN